jgi:hypothetical protein
VAIGNVLRHNYENIAASGLMRKQVMIIALDPLSAVLIGTKVDLKIMDRTDSLPVHPNWKTDGPRFG